MQCVASLHHNGFVPYLEHRESIAFRVEGDQLNITGEIVDYVHTVQFPGLGHDSHLTTKVHVHSSQMLSSFLSLPNFWNQ